MAKEPDPATLIRSSGRRVTNARLAVASVLQGGKTHMTATQVVVAVESAGAYIDQSTVYRVLADLRDSGLIAESRFGPGEATYEWIAGANHHHLHCSECGRSFPLEDRLVGEFITEVGKVHGFEADATHMVLTGVCADCRERRA